MHNEAAFFLAIAFADSALFGFKTPDDLQRKEIPAGDDILNLRFNDLFLSKPILRKCSMAGGVTDGAMPKAAFRGISTAPSEMQDSYPSPAV